MVLCDGTGREAFGRLTRLGRRGAEVMVEKVEEVPAVPAGDLRIRLHVAGIRPERLAWIAEKATELSASAVTIVRTERTQAFRAPPEALARLERVARAAAEQCGAARWPEVKGPQSLARVLEDESAAHRLFLDAGGSAFPASLAPGETAILVGPEGGWTDPERGAARNHGWLSVALPAGDLRAETAAIAALVLARAALTRGRKT